MLAVIDLLSKKHCLSSPEKKGNEHPLDMNSRQKKHAKQTNTFIQK
jgi:hypothetical protein